MKRLILLLALCFSGNSYAQGLKQINDPGVSLLALGVYDNQSQLSPKLRQAWKKLAADYTSQGLKIVILLNTPQGACQLPGFSAEQVVCGGFESLGVPSWFFSTPTGNYLWTWYGQLLKHGSPQKLSQAASWWLSKPPRLQLLPSAQIPASVVKQIKQEIDGRRKFHRSEDIVKGRSEGLPSVAKLTQMNSDIPLCKTGAPISQDSLMAATISSGSRPKLRFFLYSVEQKCRSSFASSTWNPQKPQQTIQRVYSGLLTNYLGPIWPSPQEFWTNILYWK